MSLTKAGLTVMPSSSNEQLNQALKALAEVDARYAELFEEAVALKQQPAVLQWLSDTYAALERPREIALRSLLNTWATTANNFEAIAQSVQGTVDEQTRTIIRTRLTQAIGSAKELKALAEKLEARGVLAVESASN